MIINWKETLPKITRAPLLFQDGGWVKRLTGIDFTKSDELAFIGTLIPKATRGCHVECHDGLYLIYSFAYIGGLKHAKLEVGFLYTITGDKGKLVGQIAGEDWAIKLRDHAAELLEQQPDPLAHFTAEELEAALAARRKTRPINTRASRKTVVVGRTSR